VPIPPDYTTGELVYLAADADDRRTALAAAAVFLARGVTTDAFGHHERRVSTRQWLDAATEAYRWLQHRESVAATSISLIASNPRKEGSTVTTSLNLQDDQEVSFTLMGADDKNVQVPAPTDTWTWSSDDSAGAIVTLTVSDDTTSATVAAVAPGTATISVSGANTGLQGAEACIVSAGPAVTIDLVPGTPTQEA
jgi:hypothetical protein